jgi:primary-amine oxidase
MAGVDLVLNRVTDLLDAAEIIPMPRRKRTDAAADLPPPRTDLKPLNIVQPDGPSFRLDGWHVA